MHRQWYQPIPRAARIGLLALIALATGCGDGNNNNGGQGFTVTKLVSNQAGQAPVTDSRLTNAWGIARAANGPWWVSDNHSGSSTVYDGNGMPFPAANPLVVTIPPPAGSAPGAEGAPTGIVVNTTADFVLTNGGPAVFIFDTEDGTLAGWNLNSGTVAEIAADNSADEAIYKGLAIGTDGNANRLYASNFHAGTVDVFDGAFQPVVHAGAFTDPNIPAGYAPFGIQNVGGDIFVTYAKQDENKEDDSPGAGNGYVDVYNGAGVLQSRFATRGHLNSPWGIVVAPSSFGPFNDALIIGNFGDGHLNAYDRSTGAFQGPLKLAGGGAVTIEGLWGLAFGNGANAGSASSLYFAAGPNEEADGLFGMITANGG